MKKILIIFFCLFVSSCDLFNTRDSEDPTGFRNNFTSPTTPEILFDNFQSSFNDKIIENYTANFIDKLYLSGTYKFISAGDAISEFPRLLDWTIADERQYFTRLTGMVPANQKLALKLTLADFHPYEDSSIYLFDYEIAINSDDENIPDFYGGTAQFTIKLDSRNFWVITRWQDISNNKDDSWSVLKGKLY